MVANKYVDRASGFHGLAMQSTVPQACHFEKKKIFFPESKFQENSPNPTTQAVNQRVTMKILKPGVS